MKIRKQEIKKWKKIRECLILIYTAVSVATNKVLVCYFILLN